jgi:hypothetical protein
MACTKKLRMAKNEIRQSLPEFGNARSPLLNFGNQFGRTPAGIHQIQPDQWPDMVRSG